MDNQLQLTALSVDILERLLRQSGAQTVTAESLAADIEAGAPRNADGTVNFIEFAAWLFKETEENDVH